MKIHGITPVIKGAQLHFISLVLILAGCGQKEQQSETPAALPQSVFKSVPSAQSGITFKNTIEENIDNYFDFFAYVYNGGGVGIGDINNDGLPDVYFTGNQVPNKLYLNEGNLKFRDITESSGTGGNGRWNNGVAMADVNGDGLLDIYVCKGGWHETKEQTKNLLYINQGDLTFKEQAKEFGLDDSAYSIHASFFDIENDNDLDLYVSNRPDSFDLPLTEMLRQKVLSPTGSRDKLYRNDNGKFAEVGLKSGINSNYGYALSIVTSDLNNDGYTDIYVANDFAESDYLYINQKNGKFKEQIKKATNHISLYSMGTDVADINNDGLEDIMVSEMLPEDYKRSKISMPSMDVEGFNAIVNAGMHKQYMHNALHLNQGGLFFSEISQLAGVAKTDWSWACLLSDFDNDGYRDIFVANGYKRDVFYGDARQELAEFVANNRHKYNSPQEMLKVGFKDFIEVYEPIKVRSYLFRNRKDLTFEDVSFSWGIVNTGFSNGAAIGDLDNDGDVDLVVNNIDDEAFVYENTSSPGTNYLKIKLAGPPRNADGIGAKATIYHDGGIQYFENKTVRGYLSSNEPVIHFGLGKSAQVDSIRIMWNDGKENRMKATPGNQTLKVNYSDAVRYPSVASSTKAFFNESTASVLDRDFSHKENSVNEYKDQILLPHMFSRSGPFISTGDINGDGKDDFFVGGAAGQSGAVYLQKGGKLARQPTAVFEKDKAYEDMGSALFDADKDGDLDLYVVSGGSEFPENAPQYQDRLYINDGKGNFSKGTLPQTISSGSCIVPFDFDGDGDVDLFRGGQVVARAYPKPPANYLFVNENGTFVDKTDLIAPGLARVGMVNAAAWADLTGDKQAELVVVGEWMPVTVFEYAQNKFTDISAQAGTADTEGWWNTVAADDLDNDGDQDLILGNIGENYKFKASKERPFRVYAKDVDANGTNDIFLARYYRDTLLVPIRGLECTSQQVPGIADKFPTFTAFANADLKGILGADIESAFQRQAKLFSSVIMVNDGGTMTIKKLPVDAQLSAITGIIVRDFDNDGKKDILVAGNKFDVEVETTPADASTGVLMMGTGDLNFKSLKAAESGFFAPYNVKDLKLIRTGDTWSAVVTINNDKVMVFSTGSKVAAKGVALLK